MAEHLGGEELRRIRMRWLVVKSRQFDYERSRPKPDERTLSRIESEFRKKLRDWDIAASAVQQSPRFPELAKPPASAVRQESPPDRASRVLAQPPVALAPLAAAVRATASVLADTASTIPSNAAAKPADSRAGDGVKLGTVLESLGQVEDLNVVLGPLRIETRRGAQVCLVTDTRSLDSLKVDLATRQVCGTVSLANEGETRHVRDWGLRIELPETGDTLLWLVHEPSRISVHVLR